MNGYYGYQPYYQPPTPNYMPNNNYIQPRNVGGSNMRVVDDFNSITANEIPMDGSCAVFLKSDNSEIQVKEWKSNGTISTTSYKPILRAKTEDVVTSSTNDFSSLFEAKMSDIGDRLAKIEGVLMMKPRKGKTNESECDT